MALLTWHYSEAVVIVTTAVTLVVSLVGLLLNAVLVMTIQVSPSLKTPPNSHLLNICVNNLVLALHAPITLPALHMNGAGHLTHRTGRMFSGLQLFLLMHCLLQYWGAFASIGYYRFKTIHKPTLSLRVRKLIVSRSITVTWVISLLLAILFSTTSAQSSDYLPGTLDPFRASFFLRAPNATGNGTHEGWEGASDAWQLSSDRMAAMALVNASLLFGLLIIVKSYYCIFRTLTVAGRTGKSRISPWPTRASLSSLPSASEVPAPPLPSPLPLPPLSAATAITVATAASASSASSASASSDHHRRREEASYSSTLASSACRCYRPEAEGELFCVTGPEVDVGRTGTWIVHYHKCDTQGHFIEDLLSLNKAGRILQRSRSAASRREVYKSRRPLAATLSTNSTTSSGRPSNGRCPDFTDISLGADIVRQHDLQCWSALKKQSVRRERRSLNNASKNSLVMLAVYLLCSLPLIICQIPGSLGRLDASSRIKVLLVCRLLFLLNSPIYPLWYLLFSARVKKCLTRMFESLLIRFHCRQV